MGLQPRDPLEWVPFAAALAKLGQTDGAQQIVKRAFPPKSLEENTLQVAHFYASLADKWTPPSEDEAAVLQHREFLEWVRTYLDQANLETTASPPHEARF